MDPLKQLASQLEHGVVRAWDALTEGWRELLSRSSNALTRFTASGRNDNDPSPPEFLRWGLLPAETWETAKSVIIRVEIPGMNRDDLDVVVTDTALRIRGERCSEGDQHGRLYHLMERAYGHFERVVPLPYRVDSDGAEISYEHGVLTVILEKSQPTPPRQLTIP